MAGHMDSYGSTNPKQEHPSGWRILGLHTEQESTKTKSNTFFSRKKEPTKSLPPQQIQRLKKSLGKFLFFFGKTPHSPGFFGCFSRNANPTKRPPDTTSASPKPFCRLSGDGLVLAKAQASIVGPEKSRKARSFVGFCCCFRWLVLVGWKKPTNQPTNPIFETYANSDKIGMEFSPIYANSSKLGWNLIFPNFRGET